MEGCRDENWEIVSSRVSMVFYQIKGLRKKCLVEFNKKAREGRSIYGMVDTVKKDLRTLEEEWNIVNKDLVRLKQIVTNK